MFASTSDTEVIAALLAEHPSRDVREALRDIIPQLRGAFSAVLLTKDEVIGFRDPYGVRPLVLGETRRPLLPLQRVLGPGHHRRQAGARDRAGGDLRASTRMATTSSRWSTRKREALCIFEFIYFARPDSVMKGQTLYTARSRMGEELAASPGGRRPGHPRARHRELGGHRLRGRAAASPTARPSSRTATSAAPSSTPTTGCASWASA